MSTPTAESPNDGPSPSVYRVGDLVIDLKRERVTRGADEIEISKLSFDLLATLVRAAPDLVPARKLMDLVWPGLVVGPETIVQRVKLVRDALGDDPRAPRYIGGVRGRGYRIVATVVPEDAAATGSAAAGRQARPRFTGIVATAVLALLTVGAVLYAGSWSSSPSLDGATPTLAVLPFENLSPSTSDTFFAVGLHDDVISALAESAPELRVIARATMTTYRSRPRSSASAIAHELDATHVLAATVRRDATVVRLTLELIDAATDTALWSHAYERAPQDAPTLRAAVAADVAARLSPRRDPASQAPAITSSAAAYDHYLRALAARPAATSIYLPPLAALESVEQPLTAAIDLDPDFGAAYAERAAIRIAKLAYNFDTSDAHVQRIADDIAAAERVAPTAPKTLAARSWHFQLVEPDVEAALETYAAAERAGLADPLWMLNTAGQLAELGRTGEALRIAEHALAIDPRSPVAAIYDAYALMAANRPVDAVRVLDFALAQSPDVAVRGMKASVAYAFTGDISALNAYLEDVGSLMQLAYSDSAVTVERAFQWHRWNGRLDEFEAQLKGMQRKELRSAFLGAGMEPLARFQGWTSLLQGDDATAAARGAEVLEFAAAIEETPRNRQLLRLLAAEGHTFAGDRVNALAAARQAAGVGYAPGMRVEIERTIAALYAWNGADDEALAILERLTTQAPHIGAAEVARDPLFTLALGDNARFAALVARLEAEMLSTRIE